MDISINVHTEITTEVVTTPPTSFTPGGSLAITGLGYPRVTVFPPHDVEAAEVFWRCLGAAAFRLAGNLQRELNS